MANVPSPSPSAQPELTNGTNESLLPISVYPDVSQFTFLPELYLVISRLTALRNPPLTTTTSDPSHPAVNGGGPTSDPTSTNNLTQTTSRESQLSGSGSLRQVNSSETSIEIKDLPAHVYSIKQGIARAKQVVAELPDIERSVAEQETEMAELRRRVLGLRERLKELGEIARTEG